jgi:hypothetical protein
MLDSPTQGASKNEVYFRRFPAQPSPAHRAQAQWPRGFSCSRRRRWLPASPGVQETATLADEDQ